MNKKVMFYKWMAIISLVITIACFFMVGIFSDDDILIYVFCILMFVFLALTIIFRKTYKKEKQCSEEDRKIEKEVKRQKMMLEAEHEVKEKYKSGKCKYCGARLSEDGKGCPSCGAK